MADAVVRLTGEFDISNAQVILEKVALEHLRLAEEDLARADRMSKLAFAPDAERARSAAW